MKPFILLVSTVILTGCTEYSYTNKMYTDVFQQVRRNTVDVLMVVDNSCSMAEEQEKLAGNFDSFISAFSNVDVDWQIAVTTTDTFNEDAKGRLLGGSDEIEIQTPSGQTVDRVAWDLEWGFAQGVALQLDASITQSTDNDEASVWCAATEAFGSGDLGTPGSANGSCGAKGPPSPTDTGDAADTGKSSDTAATDDTGKSIDTGESEKPEKKTESQTTTPQVGDLLITEILADPSAVEDTLGEWFELSNLTEDTLDLSGYLVVDDGRNTFQIPDGATIEPYGFLVVGRSSDSALNGGATVSVATDSDMSLNNAILVLTSATEEPSELFGEMVAVGITGSGIEMGLEGARLALSEPLLSTDNAGFLREGANLSIIFVSDENDYSPDPVNDYYRFFKDLKGDEAYRDNGIVTYSAVVGKDEPEYDGLPSCTSDHAEAAYGVRYVDVANRSDGALESICDEDFSPIAEALGLTASGLDVEFALSESASEATIVVTLYRDQDAESLEAELVKDVDYTYDAEANSIVFEPSQVPPSEMWIVVEYDVLATGASNEDEGTTE